MHEAGGVVQRLARYEDLGLVDVGNDLLRRLLGAGRQAAERERGARQLEEAPAVDAFGPGGRLARELAVNQLFELRRARDLLEAAPQLAAALAVEPAAQIV